MKIGIILHPYDEDKPAGLARTIFGYVWGMLAVDRENEYIIFLKKKPRKEPELPGTNWRTEVLGEKFLWLEQLRNATKVDVCFFNTPVTPLFFKPKKTVILALDYGYWYLLPKTIKGYVTKYLTHIYYWFSLLRCDKVIALSNATKLETIKLFGTSKEKIDVVYCGYNKICDLPEKKMSLPDKYFLFVGVVKARKNVFNTIKAFNIIQKKHPNYSFVVAGNTKGEYCDSIKKFVTKNNINNKVYFINYPSEGELSFIYKNAYALVFPSLIEGFGYPVLEGMDCGIPVITSNISSLAEVGGSGSALLVDPYNIDDIAHAMNRTIEEVGLRENLIKRGGEQKLKFSWEKTGTKCIEIFNKINN